MPASIGVNLRVTGHCSQGGRKYMEDLFSVAYQQTEDERDLEYAFFGIYDGHGGSEAAAFAKEHLMDSIVKQRQFWSDNDEDVLKAIRNGYMLTHLNMWKELEKWPRTVTGLPSTAGTTASIAFIRRGKIYVGHVGDSAIILGYQKDGGDDWAAKPLTLDHKPESVIEMERINRSGGKVVSKAGVPRVVWNRPRAGHKGPIKKNTPMDEIPFLAVARSLGDLWSYNPQNDEFIVSPSPDVGVLCIDPTKFRCLIFGTDGLWNMISPEGAVSLVQATERHNEAALVAGSEGQPKDWLNPSKSLVDHALERWSNTRMRADNTSVVTLMLDPPGPPRATVLRTRTRPAPPLAAAAPPAPAAPAPSPPGKNGLTIMTRYSEAPDKTPLPPCATLDGRFSAAHDVAPPPPRAPDDDAPANYGDPAESYFMVRLLAGRVVNTLAGVLEDEGPVTTALPDPVPVAPVVPGDVPAEPPAQGDPAPAPAPAPDTIQINEVSSSSPAEPRGKQRRRLEPRAGAASARVLRSRDAPARLPPAALPPALPPRPRATRSTAPAAALAPAPHKVTRGTTAMAATPESAPAPHKVTRVVTTVTAAPEPAPAPQKVTRGATIMAAAPDPAPHKVTRGTAALAAAPEPAPAATAERRAAGNCRRAAAAEPGGGRRGTSGAHSKENCRRRARATPAAAAAAGAARGADGEVHSTTRDCARLLAERARAGAPARALRSRNDAGAAPPKPALPPKRARSQETAGRGACKLARLAPPAPAARRPAPWAPALALRNRLRKRLAK